MPYTVIRDTREKPDHGWNFRRSKLCLGQVSHKLDSGDYTIQGCEDILSIERKGSVSELVKNLTEKRFENELERLSDIRHAFIACEFTIDDLVQYPVGSGLPAYKWKYLKIKGPQALKFMLQFQMQYDVHFLFCGDSGQIVASSIFKRVMEEMNGDKKALRSQEA